MRIATVLRKVPWRDLATTAAPFFFAFVIAILITVHYLQPAPPTTLTITSGPDGSAFRRAADKYQKILARNGVRLKVLPSEGSQDNLKRLLDPNSKVDIGFVQGGLAGATETDGLFSLGSLFYEPLYIFYRSPTPIKKLSELRGRRIAIGPDGSGTRALALALLKANGIEAKDTAQLTDLSGKAVTLALLDRQIDAAFMMSDSAAPENTRELLHAGDIRLFDVTQVDAYIRRFRYLSKLELGPGTFDLGSNIPSSPLTLLAPTVELVARAGLHPALSDLLIEAAREVHGRAGVLHVATEFPAPLEHEYPISDDAARFYKSGKSFSYRFMPFWLASLIDRILVVLIPTLIVLVPALRVIPGIYSWRIRSRIHRRYGELMALERVTLQAATDAEREPLRHRLEEIDRAVISLKIPSAFADQVYVLREHIKFVRERLAEVPAVKSSGQPAPDTDLPQTAKSPPSIEHSDPTPS
jgi:TRAP-type uncharacterized transport system substrate-binding protein